jgi:hypothetical protein
MKLSPAILLACLLSIPIGAGFAGSVTPNALVRGRLQRTAGAKVSPAAGIAVTIDSQKSGRSPATYSGQDGMYYIQNAAPGAYTLEVWTNPKKPLTFPITVTAPVTDVPPVNVP